jgi:hypothetical protein
MKLQLLYTAAVLFSTFVGAVDGVSTQAYEPSIIGTPTYLIDVPFG